METNTW